MKDHGEGTDGPLQIIKSGGQSGVSERKLRANRENAKKSTGPKTLRGKGYSRRNALKHGLFVEQLKQLQLTNEDPRDFAKLQARLRDELQPVGVLEEIEVERIAVCHWRLMRAWQYENAEIRLGQEEVSRRIGEDYFRDPQARWTENGRLTLSVIESAKHEIESTGEVSQDVKDKISLFCGSFQKEAERRARAQSESIAEQIAEGRGIALETAKLLLERDSRSQPEHARFVALAMLDLASAKVWMRESELDENIQDAELRQQAIPESRALDKIIRYEAAIERSLTRTHDRLERLQRLRLGDLVLPTMNVRLTQ